MVTNDNTLIIREKVILQDDQSKIIFQLHYFSILYTNIARQNFKKSASRDVKEFSILLP